MVDNQAINVLLANHSGNHHTGVQEETTLPFMDIIVSDNELKTNNTEKTKVLERCASPEYNFWVNNFDLTVFGDESELIATNAEINHSNSQHTNSVVSDGNFNHLDLDESTIAQIDTDWISDFDLSLFESNIDSIETTDTVLLQQSHHINSNTGNVQKVVGKEDENHSSTESYKRKRGFTNEDAGLIKRVKKLSTEHIFIPSGLMESIEYYTQDLNLKKMGILLSKIGLIECLDSVSIEDAFQECSSNYSIFDFTFPATMDNELCQAFNEANTNSKHRKALLFCFVKSQTITSFTDIDIQDIICFLKFHPQYLESYYYLYQQFGVLGVLNINLGSPFGKIVAKRNSKTYGNLLEMAIFFGANKRKFDEIKSFAVQKNIISLQDKGFNKPLKDFGLTYDSELKVYYFHFVDYR